MRDLLVTAVFAVWALYSVRHTWIAVLLWTWISVMNPHQMAFGFARDAPFAAIAAGIVALSMLITKDKVKLPIRAPVIILAVMVAWMCVTTLFALNPEPAFEQFKKVMKIQIMTFAALAAINDRRKIDWFVWVVVGSIAYFGIKGGVFTLLGGGSQRVYGPPGGFWTENNACGLTLIVAIPLLNYLRLQARSRWVRYGLLATMLLSATAALGSQSRGAFLALGAMALVLWWRSRRKVLTAAVTVATAAALVSFMPSSWTARMDTIDTYQEDTSAMGRINAWTVCWRLANERPLIGGGFEFYTPQVFQRLAPNPDDFHVAHSIYFQMLGEHGYPGLILFLLLGVSAFRSAARVRRMTKGSIEDRWAFDLAGMCQVSLAGFAVGGAFLSLAYFDLPYDIIVVLVATNEYLLTRRRTSPVEPPAQPGAVPPTSGVPIGVHR